MDVRILVRRIVLGWILLAFIVAAFGRVTVAETNGGRTAADFLLIGAGARAAGMGGAFSAVSEGATASYWNPAGLTSLEQGEVMLGHFAWYQDVTLEFGALAYRLNDRASLSTSITYLNYGTIEGYDLAGNRTADISAYDLAAAVSFGYLAREDISVGLTAKVITQKLDDINGSTVAFDIGGRYIADRFTVAGVLSNLGPSISFEGVSESLPSAARLGFSVYPLDEKLLTSVEFEKRFKGATVIRHGVEFNYTQQYYIRSGYNFYPGADERSFGSGISIGAGVKLSGAEFDYAYTFQDKYASEDLHRFTLLFQFGQ